MTGVRHTARINTIEVIVGSDKLIKMVNFLFGKCLEAFVWPSEQFWKIFGNLQKVVGNLRKIVKIVVISMFICYMALACGRYNVRSDWLRARSERSLCSRDAHGPITYYAN